MRKQSIKRASNHIREPNRTRAQTCPSLTQAKRPRSGERGSLTQASPSYLGESSNRGIVAYAISRLGETSSLEGDYPSLKTKAHRLSDSSSRKHGRVAADLT